jgi:hypothetical protein
MRSFSTGEAEKQTKTRTFRFSGADKTAQPKVCFVGKSYLTQL